MNYNLDGSKTRICTGIRPPPPSVESLALRGTYSPHTTITSLAFLLEPAVSNVGRVFWETANRLLGSVMRSNLFHTGHHLSVPCVYWPQFELLLKGELDWDFSEVMSESEDHSGWICKREHLRSFIFLKDVFNALCKPSSFKVSHCEHSELLVSFLIALLQIWWYCQLSEWVSFTLDMNHARLQIELDYRWENELSIKFLSTAPWIQSDWKPARTRSFEVFWHFPYRLRKRSTNRTTWQRRGSNLNHSNLQKRLVWLKYYHWLLTGRGQDFFPMNSHPKAFHKL